MRAALLLAWLALPTSLALPVSLALPAGAAEERLSGEAFRELSEGYTLHFDLDGTHFGSEQYLPGQRSLWRFGEDGCERGVWFERDGAICFSYDGQPDLQCWVVARRDGQVFVRTIDDAEGLAELRMTRRDREPLACPGPNVGV